MCRLMLLVWVGALSCPVVAEEPTKKSGESPDPAAVLRKSAAAVKGVKSASYEAEYKASGWVAKRVANATGKAMVGERSKWGIEKFRSEVKLTPPGATEAVEFVAGCDGDVYFLLDPKTKKAHQDMDPMVLGKHSRNVQRIVLKVLVDPEAFKEELEKGKLEWKGVESVEGVDCDVIHAAVENQPETTWYIARKDSLPRRMQRFLTDSENPDSEKGVIDLTLRNFALNPSPASDPFKLVVPEGFSRTDEFAP